MSFRGVGTRYVDDGIALGWQDQDIQEMNIGEAFVNEDAKIVVVAEGEIYNYSELLKEMESRGHRVNKSHYWGVVPHLYERIKDKDRKSNRLCGSILPFWPPGQSLAECRARQDGVL